MGIRSGSPLNNGSTCTCRAAQGSALELMFEDNVLLAGIAERDEATEDAAEAASEGVRAAGRCARLPSRCISLCTTLLL